MMNRVIVKCRPEAFCYSEASVYVARIKPLGLTAYADSEAGAIAKLQFMFESLTKALRIHVIAGDNRLETFLNNSGLEWYYEDTPDVLVFE